MANGSDINKKYIYILIGLVFIIAVILFGVLFLVTNNQGEKNQEKNYEFENAAQATVEITKDGFMPATIQVSPNTTITWNNTDNDKHTVSSDPYPDNNGLIGFDSEEELATNTSYSYTFTESGTFGYHDQQNPFTIKGFVVVK